MGHDVGLLPGTLDLLILKALSLGPLHGYGVLLRIGQMSGGALADRAGRALPGDVSARGSRAARYRVGHLRQQPKGQVLPADCGWPKAAPRRNSRMAAVGGGDGDGVESQVGGDLTCAQSGPSSGDSATLSVPHERNARWAMSSRFTFRVAPRTWSAGPLIDDAERQARLDFGGIERYKEQCRDTRSVPVLRMPSEI